LNTVQIERVKHQASMGFRLSSTVGNFALNNMNWKIWFQKEHPQTKATWLAGEWNLLKIHSLLKMVIVSTATLTSFESQNKLPGWFASHKVGRYDPVINWVK